MTTTKKTASVTVNVTPALKTRIAEFIRLYEALQRNPK